MSFTPKNQFKANTPPLYQKIACTLLSSGVISGAAALFSGHSIVGIIFQALGLGANFICHWKGEDKKFIYKK